MSEPTIVEVRGGVAGVTASYDQLLALADAWSDAAAAWGSWAADDTRLALDPHLLASAPLAPLTFAEAEGRVLAAASGLGVEALAWEADADAVRLVVVGLRDADDAVRASLGALGLAVATAPVWVPAAADVLGRLYPDGHVVARPVPIPVPETPAGPRDIGDLVERLSRLSALSGPDQPEHHGTFELQTLALPDGRVRHVLYLPGTDDMGTLPWTRDGDARDMGANLELAASVDSDYARGVLDAVAAAGVGPDQPVLVAGHSQGGLLAARLVGADGFSIDHAVTLGSPIGHVGLPTDSRVLALEHRGDVVPLLDGGPNPDTRGQVTVVFDTHASGVMERHGYPAYAAGAGLVDASAHPSVLAHVQALEAVGFLAAPAGTVVTSQVLQAVRQP